MSIPFNNLFVQRDVRETPTTNISSTGILSIAPLGGWQHDGGTWAYDAASSGWLTSSADNQHAWATVNLPHGSTVTRAEVSGNGSNSWTLYRKDNDGSGSPESMATAALDSGDSSISNAVVDNDNYVYYFHIELDNGDDLHGAEVQYTLGE